ncbi:helix-turn-helix transcriptional regulator [Curtobacterium pusillum]|uniref:Helix-turn-helix transcriptional regulator n=1 Tax=Curtobacterium pusillum TaxID=69373 RepID=A0ABX2MFP1_9MICO|nr:helix-turn-helix transcriptional regulator [Curtobacterium pusillum]NUU14572.1 helix-turn-helix transcriptional regulator [Curtobacterium pusillum]GLK31995.1 AraC family transcriptional regulator [Curtobacterium pusillum]
MSDSSQIALEEFPERTEAAFWFAHAETVPPHTHALGQFIHAASGVLSLITDDGTWIAPPNRVTWVPAGAEHRHRAHGVTDMRVVYLSPDAAARLPSGPAVLAVSSLAREALLALTTPGSRSEVARSHLRAVVVDEVASAPEQPLHLPEPRDPRLRQAARIVEEDLAEPRSLGELAVGIGVGERTLTRLFRHETGMGYRQWRLQLRVHRALVLLASGRTVTDVAAACGWATTSQFIDQFTPLAGMTPGAYRRAALTVRV